MLWYLFGVQGCLRLSASSLLCVVGEKETVARRTCRTARRSRNRPSRARRGSGLRRRSDPYQDPGSALVSWSELGSLSSSRYPHGASRSASLTKLSLCGHCGGTCGHSVPIPAYGYPRPRTDPSLSEGHNKQKNMLYTLPSLILHLSALPMSRVDVYYSNK